MVMEHLPRSPVSGHRHPQMVAFITSEAMASGDEWQQDNNQVESTKEAAVRSSEEQLFELAARNHKP